MNNPFDTIDARLSNIETLLLDIKHSPSDSVKQTVAIPRQKINGIRGLAKFLDVSTPTAQRLKNEKKVQAYCTGNKYYFFSDEVNASLKASMK